MVLSASGPCSICGSAPNPSESEAAAASKPDSISLPFGLESPPPSTSEVPLLFGIEDAPNPPLNHSNSSAEVKGTTEIAELTSKEPISITENGRNEVIQLPYGIDHMHDTLID